MDIRGIENFLEIFFYIGKIEKSRGRVLEKSDCDNCEES